MAVAVQYENKRQACVNYETLSTIKKSVSKVKSTRRPNICAASVRHVTG